MVEVSENYIISRMDEGCENAIVLLAEIKKKATQEASLYLKTSCSLEDATVIVE